MKWTIERGRICYHVTNGAVTYTTISQKAAQWLCDTLNKLEEK